MTVLLDSSVWVSYFHNADVHHSRAHRIVDDLILEESVFIIPEIVYSEVINTLIFLQKDGMLVERFKIFLLAHSQFVQIKFGSNEFWMKAIEDVAKQVRLKTMDLIILTYALFFRVNKFHSFDKQLEKESARFKIFLN